MDITINGLYVMYGILAFAIGLIFHSLRKRAQNEKSLIDFDDLLLEDDPNKPGSKRMSKTSPVFFGAFMLTTWMMVYMTIKGTMTEGYFGAYGAFWIAPIVAKIIWGKPITLAQAMGGEVTTTTTATTEVKVAAPAGSVVTQPPADASVAPVVDTTKAEEDKS